MKKNLVATFVLLAVWVACLPVLAQNSFNNFGKKPIRYSSLAALTEGRGVWLGWKTDLEKENLGFFVYRIVNGERQRADESFIPTMTVPAAGDLMSAGSYSFYDRFGDANSVYVIESVHSNGQKFYSSLIQTQFIDNLEKVAGISSEELEIQANNKITSVLKDDTILPADLADEVASYRQPADSATQQWVAAQPGVKIKVKKEGFYRVMRSDLQANGFDVNAPVDRWQLYVNGVEQAIIVGANGSYIEFYGKGIETLESDTQIYFLVVGTQNGKRIASTTRRRVGGTVASPSYLHTFYLKESRFYNQNVLNGDAENILGSYFEPSSPATVNFDLTGVDFNVTGASIEVTVQGFNIYSHQVRMFLNNVEIGTMQGDGYAVMNQTFAIPTSALREGANSLRLNSLNGSTDINVFTTLKLNYFRKYQAEQNRLSFYVPNYQASSVEGFASPNVRIFDTTNPSSPLLITNLAVEQVNDKYRVQLPSNRGRVLQAVEDSGLLSPAGFAQNLPSNLSSSGNNGDLIIITHKNFLTQAESWAAYRRTQGLTVKVVDIDDVLDEFNFGVSKSLAIRSFLQHAKTTWQNGPEYVLLIGDGTFDPKNYFGTNGNFIPAKLVDTVYTETSSDETLADFNNDGLAEIAIGRIPFRTPELVDLMLNKTISFENPATGGIERKVLFASDMPDGYDFEGFSNRLCALLENPSLCVMINRAQTGAGSMLLNEMNSGKYMVNYAGHGNLSVWASTAFFGNSAASQMTNTNKQTFFTLLTCLNGYYIGPTDSLTDAVMKNPNGGAVAAWASSGLTTPDIQEIMATRFYRKLKDGDIPRAGDLIKDAKQTINFGIDVRLSWNLLGDPTLKLR